MAEPASTQALPRRPLGSTGRSVSVIGFGASPLGNVFGEVDPQTAIDTVRAAYDAGIDLFDTSPYYGLTKSEEVLGKALKGAGIPRENIVLATKVGRYGADSFDFSAERVTASLHESLARLQTSYVDIIHVHDMEFGDLDQIINETLPALEKLKQQGLARHIGITGLPLDCFTYVLDRVPAGTVDVILSYCHHTLCDQTLDSLLPRLKASGVGVINASVLAMGLLTEQGPPAWHPAPPALQAAAAAATAAVAQRGLSLPRLAIKQAVLEPEITSHLVGFASPAEVAAAVGAATEALSGRPVAAVPEERKALELAQACLQPVQGTTWPSGRARTA